MTTPTTTLSQIVTLSDEYLRRLNSRDAGDFLTDADRWRCVEIRAALAKLWNDRRQELTFEVSGPPRMVSAPDPRVRDVPSARLHARGIQPLPQGGD
jgi:hypothetical protein